MNIKKIIKNKYSNWEVAPRRSNINPDALEASEKTGVSFSDIKKKYSAAKETDVASDASEVSGIDKKWEAIFLTPKDKSTDDLMEEKMRFFDESGNEVASQG
jgi:hypothetical protein